MRERLIDELGDLPHSRFLVYLMGPYEAVDVERILESADRSDGDVQPGGSSERVDFGQFVGSDVPLDRDEAVLDLLLDVRDRLRVDPGVNAFLAIDVDVPPRRDGRRDAERPVRAGEQRRGVRRPGGRSQPWRRYRGGFGAGGDGSSTDGAAN